MLVSDAFCYALLMITITATCVGGEQATQEEVESNTEKRDKREAALLIDSFPSSTYRSRPDIIYQRVSKTRYRNPKQKYGPPMQKYRPPKPKYGPPKPKYAHSKPKYGPPKTKNGPQYKSRKPVKKHRRKPIRGSKYNVRSPISKYGPVKKPYGPPKPVRPPHPPQAESFYAPEPAAFGEPAGFGEPPKDIVKEYVQPPQQNYAEPPVDSYGVPLKAANFPSTDQQYQSYQSYQQDLNVDNINSHTKNHPIYTEPEAGHYEDEHHPKYEDFNLDSYADVYKNTFFSDFNSDLGKLKSRYHFPHNIHKNRPWKSHANAESHDNEQEQVMVGGQYAEPPGRLVKTFQPSAPMFAGEDDFGPPNRYADSEVAASSVISPYVNYKNSNMAFSPQNLNDAFSITK